VCSVKEEGADCRSEAKVPGCPSGIGWLPDGRLLVASMRDCKLLCREHDGTLVTHVDLSAHLRHAAEASRQAGRRWRWA